MTFTPVTHPLYEFHRKAIEQIGWTFDGSIAWFDGERVTDSRAAEFMLPKLVDELENSYLFRLKLARWRGLFRESVETIAGFLSRFRVREETLGYFPPDVRADILSNVDLLGSSIEAFKNACDIAFLRDGFCAVLIDYPRNGENTRPFFTRIDRANIIDWDYRYDASGKMLLDRVVFVRTLYEKEENGNYRLRYEYIEVLEDRYIINKAYEPVLTKKSEPPSIAEKTLLPSSMESEEIPHTFGGIPIVFYPDNTIVPFEVLPPLRAIADADRAWYQVHADLRLSLHRKSDPVYVREGIINNPGDIAPPLKLGGQYAIDLPTGCDFKIIETTGAAIGLNKDYLEEIKKEVDSYTLDIVAIGNRSATEAGLIGGRNQGQLAKFTTKTESAVEEMFRAFDRWLGYEAIGGGIDMDLSQFKIFDPNYFRTLSELLLAGQMSPEGFWELTAAMGGLPQGIEIDDLIPESGEAIDTPENENRSLSEQGDNEDLSTSEQNDPEDSIDETD